MPILETIPNHAKIASVWGRGCSTNTSLYSSSTQCISQMRNPTCRGTIGPCQWWWRRWLSQRCSSLSAGGKSWWFFSWRHIMTIFQLVQNYDDFEIHDEDAWRLRDLVFSSATHIFGLNTLQKDPSFVSINIFDWTISISHDYTAKKIDSCTTSILVTAYPLRKKGNNREPPHYHNHHHHHHNHLQE